MTDNEIIREEMEAIVSEIKAVYNSSGRRASGEFERGLNVVYGKNEATLQGYTYLAGRGATKNSTPSSPTLYEAILEWIKAKNIVPREPSMKVTSLAYLISRKIHREGTDPSRWLKIYEQVLTPQRIQKVIDRVAQLNVNRIVADVQAQFNIIEKNV